MEIILREDIDKLGQRGQMVKVAAGYARNYLLPRRLAVAATESNKKIVEQERQAHLRRETKVHADAQELSKLMAAVEITIAQKAGENEQHQESDPALASGGVYPHRKPAATAPFRRG